MIAPELLADLTDDGDVIDLPDGHSLRLKFEPDDTWPFDEFDCYGKVADGRLAYDQDGRRKGRPEGFNGNAERLWPPQNSDPIWWQPPSDVKRTDPGFKQLRDTVLDLAAFGMTYVRLELLDGSDAYGRRIVEDFAGLGGVEPFPDRSYLAEIVSELADELVPDEPDDHSSRKEDRHQ